MFLQKSQEDSPKEEQAPCELGAEELLEILHPIQDPDLGLSIVDMGLIYTIQNDGGNISVEMTFTTPACPYGPQLLEEVKYTLGAVEGVNKVDVEVVWEPAWSMDCINEATRLELGMDI